MAEQGSPIGVERYIVINDDLLRYSIDSQNDPVHSFISVLLSIKGVFDSALSLGQSSNGREEITVSLVLVDNVYRFYAIIEKGRIVYELGYSLPCDVIDIDLA